MQRKQDHLRRLAAILEIPQDIVLDLPRITMLGNQQVLIENHKGIIEYTPLLVRVSLNRGELVIIGQNISLGSLQSEQILVEGTITQLNYDI